MLITDDFLPVPVPESLSATYLVPTVGLPSVTARTAVGKLAGHLNSLKLDLHRPRLAVADWGRQIRRAPHDARSRFAVSRFIADQEPALIGRDRDRASRRADARVELEELAAAVDGRLVSEEDEIDTLGGLVFLLAGRIPAKGECVIHPSGWRLEAVDSDPRRIIRVRLHAPEQAG